MQGPFEDYRENIYEFNVALAKLYRDRLYFIFKDLFEESVQIGLDDESEEIRSYSQRLVDINLDHRNFFPVKFYRQVREHDKSHKSTKGIEFYRYVLEFAQQLACIEQPIT